jgi:hypothetical protein
MLDSCEYYLRVRHNCESYVECVLRSKGYRIISRDQHGYDIEAYYPGGLYLYYIEVKCGPGATLSSYQSQFKMMIETTREEGIRLPTDEGRELEPKFVLCKFDDKYRLIGDENCKKLLR